ncbi:hypothetical protein BCD67_21430 [Oscillatoriales cyanobacterium USR001]|nr:hypothetical protein BCD67_21430 [Oscillatoriales cyanobacterium USR001]
MSLEIANSTNPSLSSLSHIEAELNYITPMAEKPYKYVCEPPVGIPRENCVYESHRVPIWNGRAITSELSLDRQGFLFLSHHSVVNNFYDENEIREIYYPESEQFVKEVTGAARVIDFDYNLRNTQKAKEGVKGVSEPIRRIHNDYTPNSGYQRSRNELLAIGIDNPDRILQNRFNLINLWRPIGHPVQESPLAVCDSRSIPSSDWVVSDLIFRDRVGETYLGLAESVPRCDAVWVMRSQIESMVQEKQVK